MPERRGFALLRPTRTRRAPRTNSRSSRRAFPSDAQGRGRERRGRKYLRRANFAWPRRVGGDGAAAHVDRGSRVEREEREHRCRLRLGERDFCVALCGFASGRCRTRFITIYGRCGASPVSKMRTVPLACPLTKRRPSGSSAMDTTSPFAKVRRTAPLLTLKSLM